MQATQKIIRQLDRHQLKERIKYNFCPFCYKKLKQTYTEEKIIAEKDLISPLFYKKLIVTEITNGEKHSYIEESYECLKCKRNMDFDTFRGFYTEPCKTFEKKK